jgi:cellulose synthase/poly-beta-1,6-N-acetylglucosamine synthase-like glycosyltransferase
MIAIQHGSGSVVVVSCLLAALAILLAVPTLTFLLETIATIALPQPARPSFQARPRGRIAALVPAHNESASVLPTLADIRKQLQEHDRLVVVADNCNDDTAAVAAAAGAEVVSRLDPERRGKGYALDFGLTHLAADPPEIVVIIDADCRLADRAIEELASACTATHRPVQALYLMRPPSRSPINYAVAQFAWRIKNWIRPLGLRALGLPCQLVGTGMAFPWDVINKANIADGAIVEDLKLGLELAQLGHPPVFCPTARVDSEFSASETGARTQRARWEHGHLGIIATVPRLLWRALTQRNWPLLALALDVAVPPLALLVLLTLAVTALSGLAAVVGYSPAALFISAADLAMLTLAVLAVWSRHGRDLLPMARLFSLVSFVVGKLPLYFYSLFRRQRTWIRTERDQSKERLK